MSTNMKRLAAALCAVLICVPAAFADEASKNTKIEELLKLTNGEKLMTQMFDQLKTAEMAQLSKMEASAPDRERAQQMQQKILQLLQNTLSWEKMKPMLVKIYAETFTDQEIDGILDFYRSPAGQAMLEKMPALMQRSIAMGQQMVAEVTPQIQKMVEEMKAQQQGGGTAPPPATDAPPQ